MVKKATVIGLNALMQLHLPLILFVSTCPMNMSDVMSLIKKP